LERLENEVQNNQSRLSLVLGALIILVVGILLFNFFNKPGEEVGPSQQTKNETTEQGDVSPNSLPGKYTVKEGDTLFLIAEKYYRDGEKYSAIVDANKIQNPNNVEVGTVLEIPKVEGTSPSPSPEQEATETASPSPTPTSEATLLNGTEKGATITSEFGPAITDSTYTVQEGDWLSKIADRAYGDVMAYQKIAQANNLSNPDLIETGMVLQIPR